MRTRRQIFSDEALSTRFIIYPCHDFGLKFASHLDLYFDFRFSDSVSNTDEASTIIQLKPWSYMYSLIIVTEIKLPTSPKQQQKTGGGISQFLDQIDGLGL